MEGHFSASRGSRKRAEQSDTYLFSTTATSQERVDATLNLSVRLLSLSISLEKSRSLERSRLTETSTPSHVAKTAFRILHHLEASKLLRSFDETGREKKYVAFFFTRGCLHRGVGTRMQLVKGVCSYHSAGRGGLKTRTRRRPTSHALHSHGDRGSGVCTVKCLVRVLCLSCFASRGRKCVAFLVREESLDEFAEIGRRCNGAEGGEREREPRHTRKSSTVIVNLIRGNYVRSFS